MSGDNLEKNSDGRKPSKAAAFLEWMVQLLGPVAGIKSVTYSFACGYSPTTAFVVGNFKDYLYRVVCLTGAYSARAVLFLDRGAASGRLHLHAYIKGVAAEVLEAEWSKGTVDVSPLDAKRARYIANKDELPVVDQDGAPTGRIMGDGGEGFYGKITARDLIQERILAALESGPLTFLGIALHLERHMHEDGTWRIIRPDPKVIAKNLRRLAAKGYIRRDEAPGPVRWRLR